MRLTLTRLTALALLAITTTARAAEPNNTPSTSTILPAGQLLVTDSLNGNVGRPNTVLGLFDPSYTTLGAFDDNDSPLGNNFASQLSGIPLRSDGSVFFMVSGSPDNTFVGNHAQSGQYAWYLDVRDPLGDLVPELSMWQNDELSPGEMDSIWLDSSISPDPGNPNWVGYTADMTINNIVGPGSGDSLDFFTFTGLTPGEQFTATLSSNFLGRLGLFDAGNNLLAGSNLIEGMPTLVGTADFLGRVKIGVTGAGDSGFTGAHISQGGYSLQLAIVPEPAGLITLGLGGMLLVGWRIKRRRRRSNTFC